MAFKKRPLSSSRRPEANRIDLYQHVTDKIVTALENGTAGKWVMPWHRNSDSGIGVFAIPRNVSGRDYRGINVWLLLAEKLAHGYSSDTWATYKARDWREFQDIKNQLAGPECEGMELYPAESRLIDTANKYHIWVILDENKRIPIGWHDGREVRDDKSKLPGLRQRPLPKHWNRS